MIPLPERGYTHRAKLAGQRCGVVHRRLTAMRVLLLTTPYPLEESPLPPLSLSYLSGVLAREGVEVRVLDFLVSRYRPDKLRRALEEYRPLMVGATCVTLNYPIARRMLKVCKDYDPRIFTVIGGPHVTFALEETLLRSPWIDAVVIGEGETTLVELVGALEGDKDIRRVAGIAFADEGVVVSTAPRGHIQDLDQLPLPAREMLPMGRYRALGSPCTVITSRGCPFGCIFCSGRRMFGPRVRFRNPGLVVDEIEKIQRDFGPTRINIVDDTFTLNRHHARAVCEEMLRRDLDVTWSAFARVDRVGKDLAQIMRRAGCDWMLFGVESADDGILQTVRKGITLDEVRQAVKTATEAGIGVFNSFILGLPGESRDTALKSMAFADELFQTYGARYGFHFLAPLPGTELCERAKDYGIRIISRNWSRYNANEPITETATMSREVSKDVIAAYDRGIQGAWDSIRRRAREGDAECVDLVEGRDRERFVWALLQKDLIERLGRMAPDTTPYSADARVELARRVSRRLDVDIETVRRWIGELAKKGLLELQPSGNGEWWQWTDTRKPELPNLIAPATLSQA